MKYEFATKLSNENKVDEYTVKGVIALLGNDFIIFHFIYAWPIFWESKQGTKKGREERGVCEEEDVTKASKHVHS